MSKIQIKRGVQTNLPTLAEGEFGLTTDNKNLYIGHTNGNIEIPIMADLEQITNKGYAETVIILGKDINNLKTNGKYKIQSLDTNDYSNLPFNLQAGWLIDVTVNTASYLIQNATCYTCGTASNIGKTYKRMCVNGTWKNWEQIATTGSTESTLSLGTDNEVDIVAVNPCIYRKENGFVFIKGEVKKEDNSAFSTGTWITLATLPTGFIPSSSNILSGQIANTGSALNPIITSTGAINIIIPTGISCTTFRFTGMIYVGGGTV